MFGISIVFACISLVVAIICYISTSNLYFALAIFVIYFGYYFIFQFKKLKKYKSLKRRVHSCCFFINSFLITVSVKESFEEGYNSGLRMQDPELKLFTNELNELSDYEKVKYLKNYFKLAVYKMFLNVVDIYQDQGGNILTMSENLIRECSRTEKTLNESSNLGIKHLLEFIILWALSFGILIFMKFSLTDFYDKMLKNSIFAPLIFVYFLICLISLHLFLRLYTKLSIKEDLSEWKK